MAATIKAQIITLPSYDRVWRLVMNVCADIMGFNLLWVVGKHVCFQLIDPVFIDEH